MSFFLQRGSSICVVALKNFENSRRTIYGRVMRETLKVPKRPPPFDWRNKEFTLRRSWFDRYTTSRFDDNTKVIVVDGPIAVGKTNFAKQLAADLDMKHIPEADLDIAYINQYGMDLRDLNHLMPEICRTFDHKDFCQDPNNKLAASFQIVTYMCRYYQYIDALADLLNSGQGVVLERSPFSDFVFADAMYKSGFMSKAAHSIYHDIRQTTIGELLRPHLVIYLDIPTNIVKERIKQRNYPYEKDSKVFTDQYLEDIEKTYKDKYLKDIGTHSLILMYDWTSFGDIEIVVEDIEKLDFDCYTRWDDVKLKDWNIFDETGWFDLRQHYSQAISKAYMMQEMAIPRFDAPELLVSGGDSYKFNKVLESTPGYRYEIGYDPAMGDNVWFKTKRVKLHPEFVKKE